MTEESTNNDLNHSNKDTFLEHKEINPELIGKKKDLDKVNIRQTVMVEQKIEEKTLDDLGIIEEAKKHRSANKPLHKIKDFNNNVNFCRCCNLPCEEKGIIEPFKMCDDIDNFAECGLGVSLYFYFFRFAFIVLFIGIGILSISMIIFNHHYTKGINRVCNNYYKLYHNILDMKYCQGFTTDANESINLYSRFDDWILRFTSDNLRVYHFLHNNITHTDNADDVLINYSVLNFFFLFTIFILNIYYIIFIAAQSQKVKLLNYSIRDYTVLICNAKHILIDYLNTIKKENHKFFDIKKSQQLVENTSDFISYVNEYIRCDKSLIDLKINNINMCYNLGNYIELRDEYEKCKTKIFKIKNDPTIIDLNAKKGNLFENRYYYSFPLGYVGLKCIKLKGKPLITLEKQKSDLEKQINFEAENIQIITESNFTGYMFVSFNKIIDKEMILRRYPSNFFDKMIEIIINIKYYLCCCCISKGEKIKFNKIKGFDVEDPPEPEDLYWENFKYSSRNRVIRILLVYLVSLIIISISFGLVLLFTLGQNKINENEKNINLVGKYILSFFITIIISILNEVLELVLTKFTLLEKHLSRTSFYLSLSIKITIFTFFNSAIIPLLSKHIIVKKRGEYDYNIDRNNFVVSDMLVLFIVNAVVTPLLWTFHIPYLFKLLKICLLERKKDPDKSHCMTQKELNKLYELPDMRITYKYSYIAKTIAMTLFYLPIFPLGFIISCFGFLLGYILELYNFTHLYKRPEMLDEIISKVYADYFIIILFIGTIGDIFFFREIFQDNKMSLANIIIFGILIIVPYSKFINCNFVGYNKSEFHDYPLSDVYFTFYNDYQRQNPFTKKIGLLNYLSELKKKGYLSNGAYKVAEENIENINIMEIYYGIAKGSIPLITQSVISNTNNNKSTIGRNIKQSIVAPDIKDNQRQKNKKQKYFDFQILNMFSSKMSNKNVNIPMDTITKEEEKAETKDKLINAYNNPLAINMGLGPLPMEDNIQKSMRLTKGLRQSQISDINKFNNKNNLKNSNSFEEEKNNHKLSKSVKDSDDSHSNVINSKKYNLSPKRENAEESKNSSYISSNTEINNKYDNNKLDKLDNNNLYNINQNNQNQNDFNNYNDYNIPKNEFYEENQEEENRDSIENNLNLNYINQNQNNLNLTQNQNEESKYFPRDSSIHDIDNYNNNKHLKDSLNNLTINNDTFSLKEDNVNVMFNTSLNRGNNNSQILRHSSKIEMNIPLDESDNIGENFDNHINNINENSVEHFENSNLEDKKDIMNLHNYPYNNGEESYKNNIIANNENKIVFKGNEGIEPNLSNNIFDDIIDKSSN